jgi:hypothetical protein
MLRLMKGRSLRSWIGVILPLWFRRLRAACTRLPPEFFMEPLEIRSNTPISELDVPLERDVFTRILIRELSGTLQEVVGIEEASGFVSVVGQRIGDQINSEYKRALQVSSLDRDQVRDVLVDLKRRIQGDFFVIEEDDEKIIWGTAVAPLETRFWTAPPSV